MKNKKTDVYVTVDSPKVAKKLKKVLDMFGEPLYDIDSIDHALNKGWVMEFDEEWLNSYKESAIKEGKTKVTVYELKQILFREHAKEGDVVVCGIEGSSCRYIVKFNKFAFNGCIDGKWIANDELTDYTGHFDYFIRYATEEEKALLNPVKELEVGKWYKNDFALFNHQEGYNSYGFLKGKWNCKNWRTNREDWVNCGDTIEATRQDVQVALIKEANRRYKFGDKLSKVYDDFSEGERIFSDNIYLQESNMTISINKDKGSGFFYSIFFCSCIFKEGQWAEVVESTEKTVGTDKKYEFILDNNYIKELIGVDNVLPKGFEIKISSSSDNIELEGLFKGSLVKMKY
jgi:hypothetical protein